MASYTVRWTINVDAETPEDAVMQAATMLPVLGNDTTATIFEVVPEAEDHDPSIAWQSVDLRDVSGEWQ